MRRLLPVLLALFAFACVEPAYAQFQVGQAGPLHVVGASLPACSSTTINDYFLIDPTSASDIAGGAVSLYDHVNLLVCDTNDNVWRVVATSYPNAPTGIISVFGRSGAITAQAGDYTVGQITGAVASSTLAGTGASQGASLVGVRDLANHFAGSDLEAVLLELWTLANAGQANVGTTNLTTSTTSSTVAVNSDTGTDATIPAATSSNAGVMPASDKIKLDGITAGATVGLGADPAPCPAGQVVSDQNQSGVLTCVPDDDIPDAGEVNDVALAAGAVDGGTSGEIQDDTITAADIAPDGVGASEIAADAVGSSEIATDAVGSAEIAADAVGSPEIATDAVGSSEIAIDAVGASEIQADAVNASEIAADAVSSSEIAAGAVGTSEIADHSVAPVDIDATGVPSATTFLRGDKVWATPAGGGGGGSTDISQGTRTATTVDVNSSTGAPGTLTAATTSLAGVLTASDKTKLDGIATGATAGIGADGSNCPAGQYAQGVDASGNAQGCTVDATGGGGGGTSLDQAAGEVDFRYDATIHGYYFDKDGSTTRDVPTGAAPLAERDFGSVAFDDDIWVDEFAAGSSTSGFQEAINFRCEVNRLHNGAVIRARGTRLTTTASITIPTNCEGVVIEAAGIDNDNDGFQGTELIADHSVAGFPVFNVSAGANFLTIRNLAVKIENAKAASRCFEQASGPVGLVLQNFSCSAHDGSLSPVAGALGRGILINDPQEAMLINVHVTGFDRPLYLTGTGGAGGFQTFGGQFSSNSTTGRGITVGAGNYACTHVGIHGTVVQGNNIGIDADVVSGAGAPACKISLFDAHFENSLGASPEQVRVAHDSVLSDHGSSFPTTTTNFHRTSSGSATGVVDVFHGSALFGAIIMDSGSCEIDGAAQIDSGANVSACRNLSTADIVRVEAGDNGGTFSGASDVDFEDSGDINFVLDTAPTPDQISGQIRAGAVGGGSGTEIADGTVDGEDMAASYAGAGLVETAGSPDTLDANPGLGLRVASDAIGLDPTAALSGDHALNANEAKFGASGLIFEGSAADTSETYVSVTNPTADRTVTVPDANSTTVQPQTCTGTDKVSSVSSSGVVTCTADTSGGTPGGANTQVQYNNAGALGGSSLFTWSGSTLTVGDGTTQGFVDVKCPTPASMDCVSLYDEDTTTATPAAGKRALQARSGGFYERDSSGVERRLLNGGSVEVTVDFGSASAFDASTVVTGQAWVGTTTPIVCSPTLGATPDRPEGADDALIEGMTVAIHSRVAGTGFTVKAAAPTGAHGKFLIHCVGA